MTERAGTQEARELFKSCNVLEWMNYLKRYDDILLKVSIVKKKTELVILDRKWTGIGPTVLQRDPRHINSVELSDIMKWKLLRGKFRPLQKLVDSNTNAAVISVSTNAFQLMTEGDWEGALNAMVALKGIGVATASAIFAPIFPELTPFMADEVIEAVTVGKRDYNMKVYKEMRTELIQKAALLGGDWTAELVGRALWVRAMIHAHHMETSDSAQETITSTGKKRFHSEEEDQLEDVGGVNEKRSKSSKK